MNDKVAYYKHLIIIGKMDKENLKRRKIARIFLPENSFWCRRFEMLVILIMFLQGSEGEISYEIMLWKTPIYTLTNKLLHVCIRNGQKSPVHAKIEWRGGLNDTENIGYFKVMRDKGHYMIPVKIYTMNCES